MAGEANITALNLKVGSPEAAMFASVCMCLHGSPTAVMPQTTNLTKFVAIRNETKARRHALRRIEAPPSVSRRRTDCHLPHPFFYADPVLAIPITYLISPAGAPLEVISRRTPAPDVVTKLQAALAKIPAKVGVVIDSTPLKL